MPNRAKGQLCDGELTLIRWEKERIVLPRVPKPAQRRESAQGPFLAFG